MCTNGDCSTSNISTLSGSLTYNNSNYTNDTSKKELFNTNIWDYAVKYPNANAKHPNANANTGSTGSLA